MLDRVRHIVRTHWGYDRFRPLQEAAIASVLQGRDTVVVLPTGGGKSLCFQAPAVAMDGVALVISPLISLMKDQVDALRECGVGADRLDSSMSAGEQRDAFARLRAGRTDLLYLSPERFVTDGFLDSLGGASVSFVAIDEAHCVSMWGHDFRPEYRMLRAAKERLPGVAVHAYTATATERVRDDIAVQLSLDNPEILVGAFHRPNLVYRVRRRVNLLRQVRKVVDARPKDAGIIYCIRRKDVDQLCADLRDAGYAAAPYHAGLEADERRASQDAFVADEVRIVVATVAFGMGIDKPDVRYVIHAGAPKSLEHYQQETGRAGRDGLEADCVLLHGSKDFQTWRFLIGQMEDEAAREIALAKLYDMSDYCGGVACRHESLVGYFGQTVGSDNCGACDVCLGEIESMDESLVIAQKILSCVRRLREFYGAAYTAQVLAGSSDAKVAERGHENLSTYGLLADHSLSQIRDWIEQLISQGCLEKRGEYSQLTVTHRGWETLRGERPVHLVETRKRAERGPRKARRSEAEAWEGVDAGLFEALRAARLEWAKAKGRPAYTIVNDVTLIELARRRPSSPELLLQIHGIGARKARQYGEKLLAIIAEYCHDHGIAQDVGLAQP